MREDEALKFCWKDTPFSYLDEWYEATGLTL